MLTDDDLSRIRDVVRQEVASQPRRKGKPLAYEPPSLDGLTAWLELALAGRLPVDRDGRRYLTVTDTIEGIGLPIERAAGWVLLVQGALARRGWRKGARLRQVGGARVTPYYPPLPA